MAKHNKLTFKKYKGKRRLTHNDVQLLRRLGLEITSDSVPGAIGEIEYAIDECLRKPYALKMTKWRLRIAELKRMRKELMMYK